MPKPLQINEISLGRASLILTAMIFLSRVAGFGRNLLTSHFYGTTPQAEAFNAAFAIPEVMSIVIAGGALATGFVPTFSGFLARGEDEKARHTFASLLSILFGAAGVLTLALIALTATPLLDFIAERTGAPAVYYANLRLLLVAQFFFILGGVFTGAFNSLKYFWLPALQPVCFNLGIIALGLFGALTGRGIIWQSYGAILGAFIGSIALQIPFALRAGLPIRPSFDFKDEGVQKVMAALVPVFFGLASGRILVLSLPLLMAPDQTVFTNATRLAILPLELLASGSAIAIFPTLSNLAARGELGEVKSQLFALLSRIVKRLCVASLALVVVAFPLVKLLFQSGKFSAGDAHSTAQILMIVALSLPALGAQQLLARGFFALGDNRTPVVAGLGAMALFGVTGAVSSALGLGTLGVAGASVLSIGVLAAILWRGLTKELGHL